MTERVRGEERKMVRDPLARSFPRLLPPRCRCLLTTIWSLVGFMYVLRLFELDRLSAFEQWYRFVFHASCNLGYPAFLHMFHGVTSKHSSVMR